jgi:tetratricopeptide (TPR) repeat protein
MKIKIDLFVLLITFCAFVPAFAQKTAQDFYALGKEQRKNSQIDEATKSQTECIRLNPKEARCFLERGELYGDARMTTDENYNQAISDYSEAIRIKPDYWEAYEKRAFKYYFGKRDYDKAFPDLVKLMQLKPDSKDMSGLHYLLGTIYASGATVNGIKGPDHNKAIAEFSTAIKLDVTQSAYSRPQYFGSRGQSYTQTGKYDEAIADLTEALRLAPAEAFAFTLNRAKAYEKKGDYTKAMADVTAFMQMPGGGTYPDAVHLRASIYCKTGKQALAAAEEKRAAALYAPVKTPCAVIPTGASPVSAAGGKTAEQLYAEGVQLAKQKDHDGAIAAFDKCIEAKADAFPCFLYRGNSHGLKGNTEAALKDYNRTIEINPNLPNAYFARGVLYMKLRKKDLAAADFRAALKIEPDHRQASQALQSLGLQP